MCGACIWVITVGLQVSGLKVLGVRSNSHALANKIPKLFAQSCDGGYWEFCGSNVDFASWEFRVPGKGKVLNRRGRRERAQRSRRKAWLGRRSGRVGL